MKALHFVVLASLCLCLFVGCKGKDRVKWYTCNGWDESFSVKMPGDASDKLERIPTGRGSYIEFKSLELATPFVHYSAGYTDYSSGHFDEMGKNSKEIFDKAQQAVVQRFKAKVLEQKDLSSQGVPKRCVKMEFYVAEDSRNMILRQDIYLFKRRGKERMYIVQSVADSVMIEKCQDEINQYQDSFWIKKNR